MFFEDQFEIKFEFVDIFYFVLNMFVGFGMNVEEIFKFYYLKNKYNFEC